MSALGITFDHYGGCKFGTEERAKDLPWAHKDGVNKHGLEGQLRKLQIMRQYKFALGLENMVSVDYVTEKFYHMFVTGYDLLSHLGIAAVQLSRVRL